MIDLIPYAILLSATFAAWRFLRLTEKLGPLTNSGSHLAEESHVNDDPLILTKLILQPLKNPWHRPVGYPLPKLTFDIPPVTIASRKFRPVGPGVQHPKDAIQDAPILSGDLHDVANLAKLISGQFVASRHGDSRER